MGVVNRRQLILSLRRLLESHWRRFNGYQHLVLNWLRIADLRHQLDYVAIVISWNGNWLRRCCDHGVDRAMLLPLDGWKGSSFLLLLLETDCHVLGRDGSLL